MQMDITMTWVLLLIVTLKLEQIFVQLFFGIFIAHVDDISKQKTQSIRVFFNEIDRKFTNLLYCRIKNAEEYIIILLTDRR